MNAIDVFGTNDPRDPEIERLLEAFADVRLSPSVAATTRMRASVMAAAHRRSALIGAEAAAVAPAASWSPARRPAWRRPLGAAFAAVLIVGAAAGTVFGSAPGGPLYGPRLWIEMANLPGGALARAQAEVTRLDARMQEASQASAAGDGAATEAALEAFASIVEEAGAGAAGDPAATSAIEIGVARHVTVLTALSATVPAQAQPGILHALSSSTKVLDQLEHPGTGTPGSSDPGSNGGNGGNGAGGHGPSGQPVDPGNNPAKTPDPPQNGADKTPRPDKTPGNDGHDPKASPSRPDPSPRRP